MQELLRSFVSCFRNGFVCLFGGLFGFFHGLFSRISGLFGCFLKVFGGLFSRGRIGRHSRNQAFESFLGGLSGFLSHLSGAFGGFAKGFADFLSGLLGGLDRAVEPGFSLVSGLIDSLPSLFTQLFGGFLGFFCGLFGSLVGFLGGLFGSFLGVFNRLFDGLILGVGFISRLASAGRKADRQAADNHQVFQFHAFSLGLLRFGLHCERDLSDSSISKNSWSKIHTSGQDSLTSGATTLL